MALIYQNRNLDNIANLADNTKAKALQWHDYLVKNDIELLIYETIRTEAQQRENIKKGVSQTMKSYHLVGQALDFVPVNSKGETLWSGYNSSDVKKAVAEAKRLGFEWGGDWNSFIDKPHLQYVYKGYGTDTFGKSVNIGSSKDYVEKGDSGTEVKVLQNRLIELGYKLPKYGADGDFGSETLAAVKQFQKDQGITVDGIVGSVTQKHLDNASKPKSEGIPVKGRIKIVNVSNAAYICDRPSSTNSKNLTTIGKGKEINISGSVPGWWEVIYDNRRAYVNEKYGKRIK
ncbi:peptidoglycan-binding protein [Aquibacillus kalidii]|uniref:peptidoglycan-binding protein n=1 Tax=Aquibacillus kalidii TaxID=2762597 RepID=UPI0016456255|nr:peptidoglycan-binding protein [Aquibacillus kalidii]